MIKRILCRFTLLGALLLPTSLLADNYILTNLFDGSEGRVEGLPGTCSSADELWYQEIPFTVSTTGNYVIQDVFNFNEGIDITIMIYQGAFDPDNPDDNTLTPNGIDVADDVDLSAGVNYTMVVQNWCEMIEGAWAASVSGTGVVTSDFTAEIPAFTHGMLTNASDTMTTGTCGTTRYFASDATQVQTSGIYYYTDLSFAFDLDICLHIYKDSFDPDNPQTNLVTTVDDFADDPIVLLSGQNYIFVVQSYEDNQEGEFFYALAPPAPFRANGAMAGSWEYSVTAGSGIFMDFFDDSNLLFIAWFTYDLVRPDGDVTAMIGDPGHRWVTGLGGFEGTMADLDLYWTSGMIFDSGDPPPNTVADGSMTIAFSSCTEGLVTYDLGSAGVTGNFPISKLAVENARYCQERYFGPGSPGPL